MIAPTSLDAYTQVRESGRVDAHCLVVLHHLYQHPRFTSDELWVEMAKQGVPWTAGIYEVRRRLSDMKRTGLVFQSTPVKRNGFNKQYTWRPAERAVQGRLI